MCALALACELPRPALPRAPAPRSQRPRKKDHFEKVLPYLVNWRQSKVDFVPREDPDAAWREAHAAIEAGVVAAAAATEDEEAAVERD